MSVMVNISLRVPAPVGVKVVEIGQLDPADTEVPQVLVCAKSPEAEIEEMVKSTFPVLVRVTVWAVLVVFTI